MAWEIARGRHEPKDIVCGEAQQAPSRMHVCDVRVGKERQGVLDTRPEAIDA